MSKADTEKKREQKLYTRYSLPGRCVETMDSVIEKHGLPSFSVSGLPNDSTQ